LIDSQLHRYDRQAVTQIDRETNTLRS